MKVKRQKGGCFFVGKMIFLFFSLIFSIIRSSEMVLLRFSLRASIKLLKAARVTILLLLVDGNECLLELLEYLLHLDGVDF